MPKRAGMGLAPECRTTPTAELEINWIEPDFKGSGKIGPEFSQTHGWRWLRRPFWLSNETRCLRAPSMKGRTIINYLRRAALKCIFVVIVASPVSSTFGVEGESWRIFTIGQGSLIRFVLPPPYPDRKSLAIVLYASEFNLQSWHTTDGGFVYNRNIVTLRHPYLVPHCYGTDHFVARKISVSHLEDDLMESLKRRLGKRGGEGRKETC